MNDDEKNLPPLDSTRGTIIRGANGMQRYALPPSIAVGVIGAIVGGIFAGFPGVLGALIATAIFIGGGLLVLLVMRKTAHLDPMVVMGTVMATYFGKLVALLAFAMIFKGTTLFDIRVFGFTVVAGVLVWAAGVGVGFRRTKTLTLVTGE